MKDWPSIWWEPSWEDYEETVDDFEMIETEDDEFDELPFM